MPRNLFVNIFKYTPSKRKKPLENYCTEIFVYILRDLIDCKHKLSYEILKLFGFKGLSETDIQKVQVLTQKIYFSGNKQVVPDITIKLNNIINLIEVKVHSGINYYNITKRHTINQIELYKRIKNINDVFLLSKYSIFDSSINNKVLWSQIYSLLKSSNNEIIQNFVSFLGENGMESFVVKSGDENGLNSIYALSVLLDNSLKNIIPNIYEIEDELNWDHYGYYIKSNNHNVAWIGQYREKYEYLVIVPESTVMINKAKKILKEKESEIEKIGEDIIFSKIEIKSITLFLNETEQVERIRKWYNEDIKILLER